MSNAHSPRESGELISAPLVNCDALDETTATERHEYQQPFELSDFPIKIALREIWLDYFWNRRSGGDNVEIYTKATEEEIFEAEEDYYNLPKEAPDFSHFVLFKEGWWKFWSGIFACGMVTYSVFTPTIFIIFLVLISNEGSREDSYRAGEAASTYIPPLCLQPPLYGKCSFFGDVETGKFSILRNTVDFSNNNKVKADTTMFVPGDGLCPVSFSCSIQDPTITSNTTSGGNTTTEVIHQGSTDGDHPLIFAEEVLLGSFFLNPSIDGLFSTSSNLHALLPLCPNVFGQTPPGVAFVFFQAFVGAVVGIATNVINAIPVVAALITSISVTVNMAIFYIRHLIPIEKLHPEEGSARKHLRAQFEEVARTAKITSSFGTVEKFLRMTPLLGFKCVVSSIIGFYSGVAAGFETPGFYDRTPWERYTVIAVILYNGAMMKTMADFATLYMSHKVLIEYRKVDAALYILSEGDQCCGRFNVFHLIWIAFRHTYSITFDLLTTAFSVFSHVLRLQFKRSADAGGEAVPLGGVVFTAFWCFVSLPFIATHIFPGFVVYTPGMFALLGGMLVGGAMPCLFLLLISLNCRIERVRTSARLKEGYYLPVYNKSACSWAVVIIQMSATLIVATLLWCLGISFCVNLAAQMYENTAYTNTVEGYFSAFFRQFELRSQTCYMLNVYASQYSTFQHFLSVF